MWHTVVYVVQCELWKVIFMIYLVVEPSIGVEVKEEAAGEVEEQL